MLLITAAEDDSPLTPQVKEKALLDTEELKEASSAQPLPDKDKVELDLDDAPFLAEEEEEAPPPPAASTAETPQSSDEPAKPRSKKKLFMAIGGGVVLLAAVLFFLLRPKPAPGPETVAPEPPKHAAPAPGHTPAAPPVEEANKTVEYLIPFDPFWIEIADDEGKARFLRCKFSFPTTNETLKRELDKKKLVLRDAIFYYLRNKNIVFLSDKTNGETLKKDLLSVVNQYLVSDQLHNLLIEEYLVK